MIAHLLALLLTPAPPDDAAAAVTVWRACLAGEGSPPTTCLEAAGRLRAAAATAPRLTAALAVLRAEALLQAGQPAPARAAAEEVIPLDRRWAPRAAWTAARAALQADDCRATIRHLERARPDPPWIQAAPRLALTARAWSACADPAAAQAAERALAVTHPDTPEGRAAAARTKLSPEDRLARADALEQARDYPAAQAELETLLETPHEVEARFRLGKLHLDRIREDFGAAARAFEQVVARGGPRAEEAAYLLARARGRAGDVPAARKAYSDYVARWPGGRFVDDALFFSAFLDYESQRYPRAARAFATIRRGPWREAAAWYRAWSLYLAGDPGAVAHLDRIAEQARAGSPEARQAAYWAARALEKRAPREAAGRRLRLVQEQPLDWYALLIRRRHPGEHPPVPGFGAEPASPPPPLPPQFADAAAEIRALHAAGLDDFARRALDAIAEDLRRAGAWPLEATLAREIGDSERLYRATMIRHRELLRRPPQAADATLWRGLFPRGHADVVEPAAQAEKVPPELVYSFIRKESAFDVDALSPAHAIGLMQLLPRTAERIRERRGEGGAPAGDLFDPAFNVALGTWYVAALGHRFGDQLPLVSAAYNAGPTSVLSWFRAQPQADTDVFVDTIPFRETRDYVKRMAETLVAYRMVYLGLDLDRAVEVLPVRLDLAVRPGVDF